MQSIHVPNELMTFSTAVGTLSEAISLLGCRRNITSGSVLIKQLSELQLHRLY